MRRHVRKHSFLKQVSIFLALALCIGFAGGALLTRRSEAAAEEVTGYDSIYSSDNPVPEVAANVRRKMPPCGP